ncbi:NUDIX domain-containing protein [Paenibacillus sp. FSL R5-0527]|uniref:NUDIX domain-containing protein n=1 Tax=Paenibacillus sp. FSL R5-0527 TaxID=2975321 RepID=UPI00097A0C51|nr:hypothetical protein BK140_14445 [Paenibacillus macerans]
MKYQDHSWGIPGGLIELGESVEECLRREIKKEIGLDLGSIQLFGVFSGDELYTKLRNGHEYFNVVVAYICTEFNGEIKPDGEEVLEADFFHLFDLPESTQSYFKEKIQELGPGLEQFLKADR